MSTTRNFSKIKVQVTWDTEIDFTEDTKGLKPYKDDADKLIKKITKAADDWGLELDVEYNKKKDTAKVTRVKSIEGPQTNNGHQGESGHFWQWQLDVETAGKGSKIRLYADDVKAKITKQKQLDDKVRVGSDEYIAIECDIEITGEFTAGQKH